MEKDLQGRSYLVADDTELPALENLSFPYKLGKRYLYASEGSTILFTDNETRLEGSSEEKSKDTFHEVIVRKKIPSLSSSGTKAAFHYHFPSIPGGSSTCIYVRCSPCPLDHPLDGVEEMIALRKKEADFFYETIHPEKATLEEKTLQRQALAGMIWNKQIYLYDVDRWLSGDDSNHPPPSSRYSIRNVHWKHLNSMRIFSMPDKWEYPWFAAWDQAFHSVIWSLLDMDFAKEQLWLLLFDQFQHPNGQIPAYEWEFSDLNPPLQGWACLYIFRKEQKEKGKGDREFLERCFHKLLMNFAWWVNKIDNSGNNIFEGGFLGFDNITVLDRSKPIAEGVTLQQSDGTGWMAFFCLNLMKIALELSLEDDVYESLATKFFEHYVYIAQTMAKKGEKSVEIWDPEDGFFYDVLRHEDGNFSRFHLRSLVGIIPLFAVEYFRAKDLEKFPAFAKNFFWFLKNRKEFVSHCVLESQVEGESYYVLCPLNQKQLESILGYIWNPEEFRSVYGLRSLSKYHEKHPFVFWDKRVSYEPAESLDRVKGGNSNWRGPVWMPLNFLLIQSLHTFSYVFQEKIAIQAGGESPVSLKEMTSSFAQRVLSIFLKNHEGIFPYLGKEFPFMQDPNWTDSFLFYEYFNPETGKGLGASHQSGWTSLIANVIDFLYSSR
ncbi:MAG: glucosidase [Chlamydiae bacterium]|nr:glucosidase [Chlamydiota bacterium]